MKSIRYLVPGLVVALALLGVLASTASATATPTWFECAKAEPKSTGNFNNKTCTEANETSTGKYVLQEGIGTKGKLFKGKTGPVVLHVKTWLGDNTVSCAKGKTLGKPALPNLEKEVSLTLSKCVALNTKKCVSAGAKTGEIKVTGLKGELGYLEEEPVSVGLKLESEANPGPEGEMAEFECEGLTAHIIGGVIGVVHKNVNVVSKESELEYLATENIGEHEFEGKKYKPLANLLGWGFEKEEIEKEIEEDLKGEKAKIVRPIIKSVICGEFIKNLLGVECTPEAYSGLDATDVIKGEAVMIKA